MYLQLQNHLRFADGYTAVKRKIMAFFLISEVDLDWAGQVRRLLRLFLVFEHKMVINFGVVVEDMVQEVEE